MSGHSPWAQIRHKRPLDPEWVAQVESHPFPDTVATGNALDRLADQLDQELEIMSPAASVHEGTFGATFNLRAPAEVDAMHKAIALFSAALQATLELQQPPPVAELTIERETED